MNTYGEEAKEAGRDRGGRHTIIQVALPQLTPWENSRVKIALCWASKLEPLYSLYQSLDAYHSPPNLAWPWAEWLRAAEVIQEAAAREGCSDCMPSPGCNTVIFTTQDTLCCTWIKISANYNRLNKSEVFKDKSGIVKLNKPWKDGRKMSLCVTGSFLILHNDNKYM